MTGRTPHRDHLLVQILGEDAVPIVDQVSIGMIAWQRLPKLLQGPLRRRVGGDVVMKDSPGAQFHDDEHIHGAEAGRDDHEEITCHDCFGLCPHPSNPLGGELQ
jgi:hypothetical protein